MAPHNVPREMKVPSIDETFGYYLVEFCHHAVSSFHGRKAI